MTENPFDADSIDREIIAMLQKDASIDAEDIAEKIGKSEAVVGNRILKLERRGLIGTQIGINIKTSNITLAFVQFKTANSALMMEKLSNCPFVLNAYRVTGEYDVHATFVGTDLKSLDNVLNNCYRTDEGVKAMNSSYVFDIAKDMIAPINFDIEKLSVVGCPLGCNTSDKEKIKLKRLIRDAKGEIQNSEINTLIQNSEIAEMQ